MLTGSAPFPTKRSELEVQSLQIGVFNLIETQFECEIRRSGKRPVKAMDRPQPALRARKKAQRRHGVEGCPVIEAAQPRTDQAHVVIERQPTHEDVSGGRLNRAADRTDIREQIGVRSAQRPWDLPCSLMCTE